MRRLRHLVLALALSFGAHFGVKAEEHIPTPNVEFNVTLAIADTSVAVGPQSWSTTYSNLNNGTAVEPGTPGIGQPGLIRNGTAPYPTLRLPGGVTAAYVYGKPDGVSQVKFRYAGDESEVGVLASDEEGMFAKIENLEFFKRTPQGEYGNVEVMLEGIGGQPLDPEAKPTIERVVVTTGIMSQGCVSIAVPEADVSSETIADAKVTTWPLLSNYMFDTRGGALRFENGTAAPGATAANWTLSYEYAFSVTGQGDWGVFKLDGPTFAVAPKGASLHVVVPPNSSWIGVNATRGPTFGELQIKEDVKIDGYAPQTVSTKDTAYGKDQLVWFRSLDPRVQYNLTLFPSLLNEKSAVGINSITFYSGLGDGEYPDPNAKNATGKDGVGKGDKSSDAETGTDSAPKKKKSNAGAIAGGVVGGVPGHTACLWPDGASSSHDQVELVHSTRVRRCIRASPATLALELAALYPYEPYEPWGTGSLRSESALAVNSGSDVGANTVTATGGAPIGGAKLERKASIKKRGGVPWPLVTRGSQKSKSSKGSHHTRGTHGTEKTERTDAARHGRERSDRRDTRETRDTGHSQPKSNSSCGSGRTDDTPNSSVPWGLQAQGDTLRTLSTLSTVSVPLSAVGVPSGQSGPAPWQDVPRATDAGSVTEEDLMDPPLYNPAWSERPRAQRARSQDPRAHRLQVRENSAHRHTN
ncbi:hypothetical protein A1Q2_04224 [Trichosporon asahii var. asahii CBS 8904]|uniref:Uncharacterized protein n=1 Tax=Trichosporon asahii var. asahii (strain CBS 8904) TaxID=1220162 RepID=K1VBT8_TRIAC|nr:hypothetical protein A1Q2_04224 [Trichosporon asahii var. asahii CBS 8904]